MPSTMDWSSRGCRMIQGLRRAGAHWLFASRGRVVRRPLHTEAPIIGKAIFPLHTTLLPAVDLPVAEDFLNVFFFG